MKPSPETPLEAYVIAEAAEAAGVPAGVVNLVCGDRAASDHLVCNPGVDKVSFTGSTAVGKRIASVCGEAHRALHAGARRQVGGDRARRLPTDAAAAPHRDHHADERAGVRDAEPRDRAAPAA